MRSGKQGSRYFAECHVEGKDEPVCCHGKTEAEAKANLAGYLKRAALAPKKEQPKKPKWKAPEVYKNRDDAKKKKPMTSPKAEKPASSKEKEKDSKADKAPSTKEKNSKPEKPTGGDADKTKETPDEK